MDADHLFPMVLAVTGFDWAAFVALCLVALVWPVLVASFIHSKHASDYIAVLLLLFAGSVGGWYASWFLQPAHPLAWRLLTASIATAGVIVTVRITIRSHRRGSDCILALGSSLGIAYISIVTTALYHHGGWTRYSQGADDQYGVSTMQTGMLSLRCGYYWHVYLGQNIETRILQHIGECWLLGEDGTRLVSLGEIPLEILDRAPPLDAFHDQYLKAVPGMTYCIAIGGGMAYAKIKVRECNEGESDSESDDLIVFDYAIQTNGGPSFESKETPIQRLATKELELQERLTKGVSAFRTLLVKQATDIRNELATSPSNSVEETLQRDLRDVARSLVALDSHERECRETLAKVRSAKRRVERSDASEQHLSVDAGKILAEIEELEREAGSKLEVKLGPKLGAGPIEETLVDEKLLQLKRWVSR